MYMYIDSDNWWYGGMGEAVGGAGAGHISMCWHCRVAVQCTVYSVQCSVHASGPLYRGGAGPAAHHRRLFQRFAQSSANVPALRARRPGQQLPVGSQGRGAAAGVVT